MKCNIEAIDRREMDRYLKKYNLPKKSPKIRH